MKAAEVGFYGNARLATWCLDGRNWDVFQPNAYDPIPQPDPAKVGNPDQELIWDLMTTSRLGFRFQHTDQISGLVEYGAGGPNGVNLRHLYGNWKKGDFEILVGQSWTPTTLLYSEQAFANDDVLFTVGFPFAGRQPMIQFKYKALKLALIHVHNASAFEVEFATGPKDPDTGDPPAERPDVDVLFPKIEVGLHHDAGRFVLDLYGGYQTYQLQGSHIQTKPGFESPPNLDVDAWLAGVGAGIDIANAYLKANLFKVQNGAAYGLTNESLSTTLLKNPLYIPEFEPAKLLNTESLGYALVLGWKFNHRFRIEAGYGHIEKEHDASKYVPSGFIGRDKTDAYYLQAPVMISKLFTIVPEAGYYDLQNDHFGRDQGGLSYFGAKWQINF